MCEGAVSAEMLNRYASVARRVPIENRRRKPVLVGPRRRGPAAAPPAEALLLDAERHGWTSDELARQSPRDDETQSRLRKPLNC